VATVDELLTEATKQIKESKKVDLWRPSDARVNAEELLGDALGKEIRSEDFPNQVPPTKARKFQSLLERRLSGEPIALIIGYTEFRGMRLRVTPGVFVPRSSSEFLAEKAIKRLRGRRTPVAVDIATGTGPVALAIAHEVPSARVFGLDIWPPSLRVAKQNASSLGLKVEFKMSDLLANLPQSLIGAVDVMTCHPPYVARSAVKTLSSEIREFEPVVSLTDNSRDGLGMVRALAEKCPDWLRKKGWILFEVSSDLSRPVSTILRRSGFDEVKSDRDSLGATRVVSGRRP